MYFVWYDDNPKKTISAKIDDAVLRYKQKYGKSPKICMLNEKTESADYAAVSTSTKLEVLPTKYVRQNYFWIGMEG